jgi:hypothetical protein
MPEAHRLQLLPGTLEMLILQTLIFGPRHGHGIATTIKRKSDQVLLRNFAWPAVGPCRPPEMAVPRV